MIINNGGKKKELNRLPWQERIVHFSLLKTDTLMCRNIYGLSILVWMKFCEEPWITLTFHLTHDKEDELSHTQCESTTGTSPPGQDFWSWEKKFKTDRKSKVNNKIRSQSKEDRSPPSTVPTPWGRGRMTPLRVVGVITLQREFLSFNQEIKTPKGIQNPELNDVLKRVFLLFHQD